MKSRFFFIFSLMCFNVFSAVAAEVPAIPRPEHPRPQLKRGDWLNLNGEWFFQQDPEDKGIEEEWFNRDSLSGTIIVPFPVESELSRVADKSPAQVLWYLRTFDLPSELEFYRSPHERLFLHFGAVDYQAEVWLNGQKLGEHTGGYTPFSFDITEVAKPYGNRLCVRVYDSLSPEQVRGKQSVTGKPFAIFYTPVSGIWQTVWIEKTGYPRIVSYRFFPSKELDGGRFELEIEGPREGLAPRLAITGPDGEAVPEEDIKWEGFVARWRSPGVKPWSPESPRLYRLRLSLANKEGKVIDEVESYIGVRTIETREGKVFLNGKPFYQKLLLDQGYFPRGIYTAEDDAAFRKDCETYKRMGFNGLRKHQKIEDPRFLYWCDRLGLVVWEEMPSLGALNIMKSPSKKARARFQEEWLAAIRRDFNHPCIITWTIFNENWGIYPMLWDRSLRRWAFNLIKATREADPTRLVCDNSGGFHFDTDIFDFHHYLPTAEKARKLYESYNFKPGDRLGFGWYFMSALAGRPVLPAFFPGVRYQGQPIILSEYGGFGWYKTEGELDLLGLYREYTLSLRDYPFIQGYCYTQPYDVEQETNGLMSFDREPKVPLEKLKQINDMMGAVGGD